MNALTMGAHKISGKLQQSEEIDYFMSSLSTMAFYFLYMYLAKEVKTHENAM